MRVHSKRVPGRITARQKRQRGIALLLTLLLLILMSILGLVMVLAVSSDMMINGYYGSYRSSFYAADSGISVARAALLNNLQAQVSMTPCETWGPGAAAGCTSEPLPSTAASTALSGIQSTYNAWTSLNSGAAADSWPTSFQIQNVTDCTNAMALASTTATAADASHPNQYTAYKYTFNYTLCSVGRSQAMQRVTAKETGSLAVTVTAQSTPGTAPPPDSLSKYGAFINNYPNCTGPLVPGTMAGKMFANTNSANQAGAWQFMTGGTYIFPDSVEQTSNTSSYYYGSSCINSPTSSYTYRGQTIAPTFQSGLTQGAGKRDLPPNNYSQQWAVLDGTGHGETGAPSSADLSARLKNISRVAYGGGTGVYLPYNCDSGTCAINTPSNSTTHDQGGGIWVQGNASVVMSLGTDAASNPTQVYAITQGTTTTTITVNTAANTTKVVSGGTTLNLAGVPMNVSGASPQAGTMLYVNGAVSALRGTGQGVPAIQNGYQTTITANADISITGDLLYKNEPVTRDTNNTLIASPTDTQVLGIFTPTGNINLTSTYSNHNLEVDASMAAISSGCASSSCGFKVPSGYINTFNNVGGQIQYNIFSANMSVQNTYFDRRFTDWQNFAPPWFPNTTVSTTPPPVVSAPRVDQSTQRLSWVTWNQ